MTPGLEALIWMLVMAAAGAASAFIVSKLVRLAFNSRVIRLLLTSAALAIEVLAIYFIFPTPPSGIGMVAAFDALARFVLPVSFLIGAGPVMSNVGVRGSSSRKPGP